MAEPSDSPTPGLNVRGLKYFDKLLALFDRLHSETGAFTGQFGSERPFVFTGANGKKLVCWYGRTAYGASKPGTFVLTILEVLGEGIFLVEAA